MMNINVDALAESYYANCDPEFYDGSEDEAIEEQDEIDKQQFVNLSDALCHTVRDFMRKYGDQVSDGFFETYSDYLAEDVIDALEDFF